MMRKKRQSCFNFHSNLPFFFASRFEWLLAYSANAFLLMCEKAKGENCVREFNGTSKTNEFFSSRSICGFCSQYNNNFQFWSNENLRLLCVAIMDRKILLFFFLFFSFSQKGKFVLSSSTLSVKYLSPHLTDFIVCILTNRIAHNKIPVWFHVCHRYNNDTIEYLINLKFLRIICFRVTPAKVCVQ